MKKDLTVARHTFYFIYSTPSGAASVPLSFTVGFTHGYSDYALSELFKILIK
jgi:hypothetical protein